MKLHIGCGKRYLKGYIHIDPADLPHIDYKTKADLLPMIASDSVEIIYASHILEYYDRNEAVTVLCEWRRVLKIGGTLRLSVPDFSKLITLYNITSDLSKIIGPLYGRWEIPGSGTLIYHKTTYDFDSLKALLEENGFYNIKIWDWKEVFSGDNKGFDDYSQAYYPHMDKENGLLISLNIEGTKC